MYRPNDMRRPEFSIRQQKYMNNLLILCTPKRRKSEFYCFVNSIQLKEHTNTGKARYKDDYLEILRFLISLVLLKLSAKLRYYVSLKKAENTKKATYNRQKVGCFRFFATNEIL